MTPLDLEVQTSLNDIRTQFGQEAMGQLRDHMRRNYPSSSAEFLEVLYADLDQIRVSMAQAAPNFAWSGGKHLSELQITNHIRAVLEGMACNRIVTAEGGSRGHVDLTVRNTRLGAVWLGEAKIYNSDSYVWGGLLQLHTRYASGFEANVGMLIYHFKPKAQDALKQWRAHVNGRTDVLCKRTQDETKFSFYTEHEHVGTQNTLRIRHMIFPLYFDPLK